MVNPYEKTLDKYSALGFAIRNADDHTFVLTHQGDMVARFAQHADPEKLRDECQSHLLEHHPCPNLKPRGSIPIDSKTAFCKLNNVEVCRLEYGLECQTYEDWLKKEMG